MYPTYQYQPPALRFYEPRGLGFKLFGKITLGKIVGGLLGSAVKIVANVVSTIPIVGPEAANQLIMAWEKDWKPTVEETIDKWIPMGKTSAPIITITPEEEAIIKFWYTYKFEPWLTALLSELKAASAINDLAGKLAALNIVLNKIETVQTHYELYETDGLAEEGINQRNALIAIALEAPYTAASELAYQLGGEEYYTNFKPSIYNFSPLFTGTPIVSMQNVSNYKVVGSAVTTPAITPGKGTATIKPGSLLDASPIKLTPGTLQPIKTVTGGTTTGNTVTTSPPKVSAPVTDEADETPAETKKNNTGVYVALGIGTAIAIYAATRKKKAKK